MTQPRHFRFERDMIDVSRNGLFDPPGALPPSPGREIAGGLMRYFIDDEPVSEDTFRRELEIENERFHVNP